ncbi:MAG: hypothetical protein EZS28_009319 [Streblomastix strix]|uniref:Uncharacterized protein n=1 Tax=Streblomastix strix TaxID=222440 RepID=A0A5J4WK19_9EUKA|nr:MAG: hypothetical protein EZS28_009319 [Streblomastix strix]
MDSGKLDLRVDEEEESQREIQTERPRRHKYNINKYKEVPRGTAQVEPEKVVMDIYLSHPNLDVQKFIIDTIWRCVDSHQENEENDFELIMDLLQWLHVFFSFKKIYRINKDFIRLSEMIESDTGPEDF